MKKSLLAVLAAFIWLAGTLFLRNEILLKHFWVDHYESLGLTFPSEPINGAIWVLWSLLFAIVIYVLSRKFGLWGTTLVAWLAGFALMEIVIANMGFLPLDILPYAIPMSFLEVLVAAFIIVKVDGK